MTWHPFALSLIAIDAVALLFVFKSAQTAVRVAADWDPGAGTKQQIALETAAETGDLAACAGFGLLTLSTFALVVAIANVFPEAVPGAMCGTGVLQATGGTGTRAVIFKTISLGIFYLWFVLHRLDRAAPNAPLARRNAKVLLLAAPFAILAAFSTFDALNRLDAHTPVDCCAVVYDRFLPAGESAPPVFSDAQLMGMFGISTGFLVAMGTAGLVLRRKGFGRVSGAAAIFSLAWGWLSAVVLVRVLSAYTYEVLHHDCPWCLFLPEHHYVGFALFGILVLAVLQAQAAYVCHRVTADCPALEERGGRFARRALAAMTVFVLLFAAAAIWPALSWRIRFGVWMA